ncbi:lytic murein transglycosylase [Nocardioides cavernaquae]|uniref:lytic murein transglycosylase n=1 Tax=Nocardioides cavernaquae TaxID=2321396 RepID=UPI001C7D4072|nr:lytic murein transglycosylase [Nocardioides cavernaquae]
MNTTARHTKTLSALVPLALLSAGWTAHLAVPDDGAGQPALPAGSASARAGFEEPVEFPASTTRPVLPTTRLVAGRTASAIPPRAVGGYQLAEAVLATADGDCHLQWELLAAIGRVESDHGRHGGGGLDAQGSVRPSIVGPALDGKEGFAAVADTDGGEFDGDARWDRAVGPMQFIPTTWAVVGVDADGDGRRNPQDIDDAALGAAVYLCSGDEDLATIPGREAAVLRYNNDPTYVDTVLHLFAEYAAAPAPTALAITAGTRLDDTANSAAQAVAASPARGAQVSPGHSTKGSTTTASPGAAAPSVPVASGGADNQQPVPADEAGSGSAVDQPGPDEPTSPAHEPALEPCPTEPAGVTDPETAPTPGSWIGETGSAGDDTLAEGTIEPGDPGDPGETTPCVAPDGTEGDGTEGGAAPGTLEPAGPGAEQP